MKRCSWTMLLSSSLLPALGGHGFQVHMWNVFNNSNECTNNQVESWHSQLNRSVGLTHTNAYRLLDTLRRKQTLPELTLRQARLGASPPPWRPKYRQLDWRDCATPTDRDRRRQVNQQCLVSTSSAAMIYEKRKNQNGVVAYWPS